MDDNSGSSSSNNSACAPPYLHDHERHKPSPSISWAERMETLSHVLTHPTLAPSLHSQLFVALRVPCFLHRDWGFPPFLCHSPGALSSFSLALFLSCASRLGLPHTSWRCRCRCPFQQPPPCLLSSAVAPAPERWGPHDQERRDYATQRLRRGRFRFARHPPELLLFILPNVALLSLLLLFDPYWLWCRPRPRPS